MSEPDSTFLKSLALLILAGLIMGCILEVDSYFRERSRRAAEVQAAKENKRVLYKAYWTRHDDGKGHWSVRRVAHSCQRIGNREACIEWGWGKPRKARLYRPTGFHVEQPVYIGKAIGK
jgi:hypothetical protein